MEEVLAGADRHGPARGPDCVRTGLRGRAVHLYPVLTAPIGQRHKGARNGCETPGDFRALVKRRRRRREGCIAIGRSHGRAWS